MATTLSTLLARINAATDSSSIADLLLLTKDIGLYDNVNRQYNSYKDFPVDSAFIGSIVSASDNRLWTLRDSNGELVWKNIYAASPNPRTQPLPKFQGTNYGYATGGTGPGTHQLDRVIQRFPFAADAGSTLVGSLSGPSVIGTGLSSESHGYQIGGYPSSSSIVNKFPFAANVQANGSPVSDVLTNWLATTGLGGAGGHSSIQYGYGYVSGGIAGTIQNKIIKISFSNDNEAQTQTGTLVTGVNNTTGISADTHGYTAGGFVPPSTNIIQKFPFAIDANATDVGDLTVALSQMAGHSSTENGYTSGGSPWPTVTGSPIQKFPFASDTNAAQTGALYANWAWLSGTSSTTNGYSSGGAHSPQSPASFINKFPFASDTNAISIGTLALTSDVGSLQQAGGQQF